MATKLNIDQKYEGSTLTAAEFNAVITAINENALTLEEAFTGITSTFAGASIKINEETTVSINTVQDLVLYLDTYGTSWPGSTGKNTPPIIKIKNSTYVYTVTEVPELELELFDAEGGKLTLTGINPIVTNGYSSFVITGLSSGYNTINFNSLVFQGDNGSLPIGTYIFENIFVTDSLGRSSSSPISIKVVVGTISLSSDFNSANAYKKGNAITVRWGIQSITNDLIVTYTLVGNMFNGTENINYSPVTTVETDFKATSIDSDFESTEIYYHNHIIDSISEVGDYTLTIKAEGLGDGAGVESNILSVNMVINEDGTLYASTTYDKNAVAYAGESVTLPINLFYNERPNITYQYQCFAWIEGYSISGATDVSTQKSKINLSLTLPDEKDNCHIYYYGVIVTPSGEVYIHNTNDITISTTSKSKYEIVTYGNLELYLTARGKSNTSSDWGTWNNRYNLNQDYYGTLYDYATVVNGWEQTITTTQHWGNSLYSSGDAYCVVNYNPFENFDVNQYSLTLDFSIRHGDLNAEGYYNLSIGKPGNSPMSGVYIVNNRLIIAGLASSINIPIICESQVLSKLGEWTAGDEYAHITITYNYEKGEVFVYLNGIISSYGTFKDKASLTHSYPIVINGALNSADEVVGRADTKIRFFRVYKSCLNADEVLSNYIASYANDDERQYVEELNDPINPVLSVGYMKGVRDVAKDVPALLLFNFIPGNEENISNTYIPDPIAVNGEYTEEYIDMKEIFPVDVDLQGNSSLSYPIKNYGMDIYDAQAYNLDKTNLQSKEYNMVYNKINDIVSRPWPDWDSYHLKANYIDSSHCNNLIMAKLSERVFRFPYNWSDITNYFPTSDPFKNFTVTRPTGIVDRWSRFPTYPTRLAIDGFPFVLNGDYTDTNLVKHERAFIGVYTWNLKQHRKLYSMPKPSVDPNKRYFIYRCESNGDSVHPELRSGYCKFRNLSNEELIVDSYGRTLTRDYIKLQENKEMYNNYIQSDYSWFPLNTTEGYLQPNGKYTWVKFGTNVSGETPSDISTNNSYIGIAVDKTSSVKSTNPTDYVWTTINISEGVSNNTGTFTLIRYGASVTGLNYSSDIGSNEFIGFVYNSVKTLWVENVDYFNKTNDSSEKVWRPGAELIMDWECREPDDLGTGHWEEFVNNTWVTTYNIVSPKDLNKNATDPDKILRFVWDDITSKGVAKRSGHQLINYWTSILDTNVNHLKPTLDGMSTFAPIDKTAAAYATQQHVDYLNAIKWFSDSSDDCFSDSTKFEKYFDLRTCLDYVLCVMTFCLTDSIGRNLTMVAWDQESSTGSTVGVMNRKPMRFYPVFYDIDTAFGTNVQGGLYTSPYMDWSYDIGDTYIAKPGAGPEWNCFGTNFLKRISKCYAKQLSRRYQELRTGTFDPADSLTTLDAPFNYLSILQMYTKQMVGRIGERYFNEDAVFKYIGYENDPDVDSKRNYITNARGNKLMFMKDFLKKRMDFVDSLLGYVPNTETMGYFQHYYKGEVELEVSTIAAGYVRISFAQNQSVSLYCNGKTPSVISYNYPDETQHILRFYNCGIITKINGLQGKNVKVAKLNTMTQLQELDLSRNDLLFSLEKSAVEITKCKNLKKLNISQCNKQFTSDPLDISGCGLLEEFNAEGSTNLKSVNFSTNINLRKINIAGCTGFTSLTLNSLRKLTSLIYDEQYIQSLDISNSSVSLDFSAPNVFNNLTTLKIKDNLTINTIEFGSGSFSKLETLIISDCASLTTVRGLFKDKTVFPALNNDFLANCPSLTYVDSIFENSNIKTLPSAMFANSTKIKTLIKCFKNCQSVNTIPGGIFDTMPNLEDITEIFSGSKLQTYSDIIINDPDTGLETIIGIQKSNAFSDQKLFSNCPKLKYATKAFENVELTHIPSQLFEKSRSLVNIDFCFSGIQNTGSTFNGERDRVEFPVSGTIWTGITTLSSANGLFKNTYISEPGNDFLISCPSLTGASEMFYNTDISGSTSSGNTLGNYFFSNCPKLVDISNLFKYTNLTSLPEHFIANSPLINNITGLFGNNLINRIGDDFFSGNTSINSISGLFDGSLVTSIGDRFMAGTNVNDITNLFNGNTRIVSIGKQFMANSCQSFNPTNHSTWMNASNAFKGAVNLATIGSGFLMNTPCDNMNYLFSGCTSLSKIGEYREWYDSTKHNTYLYSKYSDNTKVNKIGQQAEVALFTSVPYNSEEYDTLTMCYSSAYKMFAGTNLIRTPKGFLKHASEYLTSSPNLSSALSGSNIKFFNPELGSTNVSGVENVLTNISNIGGSSMSGATALIAIPKGFASTNSSNTEVYFDWSDGVNNIAYIPSNFLKKYNIASRPIGVSPVGNGLSGSRIRLIEDDWLSWPNPIKNTGDQYGPQNISFSNSPIKNLPRNYCKYQTYSANVTSDYFGSVTLDTSIPEGYYEKVTGFTISQGTGWSPKGVVPRTFLKSVNNNVQLSGLFYNGTVLAIEDGFLSQPMTLFESPSTLNNLFTNCVTIKTIPDSFLTGVTNYNNISFSLASIFEGCTNLVMIPNFFKYITKCTNLTAAFRNTTSLKNEFGEYDDRFSAISNTGRLDSAERMFQGSGIKHLPDSFASNVPLCSSFYNCFDSSDIVILPKYMLSGSSSSVSCQSMFINCASLTTIPDGFFKTTRVGNLQAAFKNDLALTNPIPSNFAEGGNGFITDMSQMFYNCGATGFVNDTWNLTGFTKLTTLNSTFYQSKIQKLPSNFHNNSFPALVMVTNMCADSSLIEIGDNFMYNPITSGGTPVLTTTSWMFNNCVNLMKIGSNPQTVGQVGYTNSYFMANSPALVDLDSMFINCNFFNTYLDDTFMKNSKNVVKFDKMFMNTSLYGIIGGGTGGTDGGFFMMNTNPVSTLTFFETFMNCGSFYDFLPFLWVKYNSVMTNNAQAYACFKGCNNAPNYSGYGMPGMWKDDYTHP